MQLATRNGLPTVTFQAAEPLWKRVPTHTEDGRPLSDFMVLIPGLKQRPPRECAQTIEALQFVLNRYRHAVVFAGDGQLIPRWGELLEVTDAPPTMIVGAHRLDDETLRLHEYSPGFDPERFSAHEEFFVEDVRRWLQSHHGVELPADRTAVFGVSASGELALALGLRHPDVYGAIFCASPIMPSTVMPETPCSM